MPQLSSANYRSISATFERLAQLSIPGREVSGYPTREMSTPTREKLKERSDEGNVRQRPDEGNVRQNFLLDPDEKIVQGDSKLTERRIKCRHEMITVS